MAAKTFLGRTIPAVTGSTNPTTNPDSMDCGPGRVNEAVDNVLEHAQPRAVPDPQAVGRVHRQPDPAGRRSTPRQRLHSANGYKLKPLIRGILMSPLIFESIDEPNLIKPPIVYIVGVLRQLDAPLKHNYMQGAMNNMQQRIYRPPNVAGWEGGMSWLNTNTVQGRFDMVAPRAVPAVLELLPRHGGPGPGGDVNYPADVVTETAQAAYDRAYASVGKPWISTATRDELLAYAGTLRKPTGPAPRPTRRAGRASTRCRR